MISLKFNMLSLKFNKLDFLKIIQNYPTFMTKIAFFKILKTIRKN